MTASALRYRDSYLLAIREYCHSLEGGTVIHTELMYCVIKDKFIGNIPEDRHFAQRLYHEESWRGAAVQSIALACGTVMTHHPSRWTLHRCTPIPLLLYGTSLDPCGLEHAYGLPDAIRRGSASFRIPFLLLLFSELLILMNLPYRYPSTCRQYSAQQ